MDALISSSSGKKITVQVEIRELSKEERKQKALRALGMSWGISILCLPLPPIHWVITPFFFFFGFYWANKKYREDKYLKAFTFACPECQAQVNQKEEPVSSEKAIYCPKCHYYLRLSHG